MENYWEFAKNLSPYRSGVRCIAHCVSRTTGRDGNCKNSGQQCNSTKIVQLTNMKYMRNSWTCKTTLQLQRSSQSFVVILIAPLLLTINHHHHHHHHNHRPPPPKIWLQSAVSGALQLCQASPPPSNSLIHHHHIYHHFNYLHNHHTHYHNPEMEKAADAADTSVLFFSAGANF